MSVQRIMGLETEFGISVPGHPTMNAMVTSSQIVNAYASGALPAQRQRPRWNYAEESPLRDARGFDLSRADADPSLLTDDDLGLANVILPNGARLYVDHAHPEYSTPEVTNPRDAVLWDRAGVAIARRAMELVARDPNAHPIVLYKNNTDNKGASYGCHENYLMKRDVPFADIVRALIPFFVSRQIFAGAGRLGIGQEGSILRYQISQRADFFETEVGLETTLKRPIINTRDEPHADPEHYRRLHVIIGDANMSDVATYMKMGTTSLVLSMIEAGFLSDLELMPRYPVRALHAISHDITCQETVELLDGRELTAIDLQWAYLERAVDFCEQRYGDDADTQTKDVLHRWAHLLNRLADDPVQCSTEVDWVAKMMLLDGYRHRDGLEWSHPRLQMVDLQYSDIRPSKGLAGLLESRGALERLWADADVAAAVHTPPADTRAFFRGTALAQYPESVAAASWDSVVFDVPGNVALVRVPTMDPWRGTKAHTGAIFEQSTDVAALIAALSGATEPPSGTAD
jgi:proteasome accessory factor PafA2